VIIVSILVLVVTAFLIYSIFKTQPAKLKAFFLPGLVLKIAAGIFLGVIYTFYYKVGDTFGFFEDARVVNGLIGSGITEYINFIVNGDESSAIASSLANTQTRSLFMVKVLSVVSLFSFNNYWVASIYFSLVSFSGSWYLIKKINSIFPNGVDAAVVAFLFVPSFVFWSSGIIKESLAIGALLFLSGLYLATVRKERLVWWEWIVGALSLWILWGFKYYWAVLFMPAALSTIIVVRLVQPLAANMTRVASLTVWLIVFLTIILLASQLHPNFFLSRFLEVIVDNNRAYTNLSGDGPFVHFYNLTPTWSSIAWNSPWAFISGVFRPFIFESKTIFQFIISIENLILVGLLILNFRFLQKAWMSDTRILIVSALVYVVLLAIFLALSTPNFGTLSRYRIGFLPALFFLLLYYPLQGLRNRIKN